MNTDELEDKLASKNTVPLELPMEQSSEPEHSVEDFVSRSG